MNDTSQVVVIGLGSNLGDRMQHLERACAAIAELPHTEIESRAEIYESDALGPVQPRFLNTALRVRTGRSLPELLPELQNIERKLGRVKTERWGPRTIDLDIVWSGSGSHKSTDLEVPHPGLYERDFVWMPVQQVAPEAIDASKVRAMVSSCYSLRIKTAPTTFESFWPYYLSQHRHRVSRVLHVIGTTLALACACLAVLRHPLWLLAAPIVGYGLAWLGHFVFEKNRPATFGHPWWSLRGDFRLWWRTLTGRFPFRS